QRIGTRADRIAHRIGTLRSGLSPRCGIRPALWRLSGRRWRARGGDEQARRGAGLSRVARKAYFSRITRSGRLRLIGTDGAATENRHHDQPAIGKLIVADDGVAVIIGFACAPEILEHGVCRYRAVESFALFREDRHSRVDDLENMVRPDCEAVV